MNPGPNPPNLLAGMKLRMIFGERNVNVMDIVEAYLREHGYDGLCGDECGCLLEDLAPCEGSNPGFTDCVPGYRHPCDCGDHDFHVWPEKPE